MQFANTNARQKKKNNRYAISTNTNTHTHNTQQQTKSKRKLTVVQARLLVQWALEQTRTCHCRTTHRYKEKSAWAKCQRCVSTTAGMMLALCAACAHPSAMQLSHVIRQASFGHPLKSLKPAQTVAVTACRSASATCACAAAARASKRARTSPRDIFRLVVICVYFWTGAFLRTHLRLEPVRKTNPTFEKY